MKEEIISYCGLICSNCPIHLASIETDIVKKNEMISKIILVCKKEYNIEYSPLDITDCDGCMGESGILFSGCSKCKIRKCAIAKGVINCAYCNDYICDDLNELFKSDPSTTNRLENIRHGSYDSGKH